MLTPRFTVRQDDEFVVVEMRVPGHVRLGEDDVWIEGRSFKFHAHPYFLSLELPGEVVQDGRERAEFDRTANRVTVWIPKATSGEHFEGLDMLTRLMTPTMTTTSARQRTRPGIEVIGGTDTPADHAAAAAGVPELGIGLARYGFNAGFSGFFEPLREDLPEIVDIPQPDTTPAPRRRELREEAEDSLFNAEHYMADLMQGDEIGKEIAFEAKWTRELKALRPRVDAVDARSEIPEERAPADMSSMTPATIVALALPRQTSAASEKEELRRAAVELTPEQEEELSKLPRREYLIEDEEATVCGLVDILFCFAFDHRTTAGESTVESGWTITKLSPTLSWLDTPTPVVEALAACAHRALAFPLHRHVGLVSRVIEDVAELFLLGRRAVLRSLLEARGILAKHEHRHYLNTLFLDDYCVWVQRLTEDRIALVAQEVVLTSKSFSAEKIRWPLADLDELAKEGFPAEGAGIADEQPKMMI